MRSEKKTENSANLKSCLTILEKFPDPFTLLKVDPSDKQELKSIGNLVKEIKELIGKKPDKKIEKIIGHLENFLETLTHDRVSSSKDHVELISRGVETLGDLVQEMLDTATTTINISSLLTEIEIVEAMVKESLPANKSSEKNTSAPSPKEPGKLEFDEDMDKVVSEFVLETQELMEELDGSLLELEGQGYNQDVINSAFRVFHTVKGNAGALGFTDLQNLVHKEEDVIKKIRDKEIEITPDVMNVLMKATDIANLLLMDVQMRVVSQINISPPLEELGFVLKGDVEGLHKFQKEFKDLVVIPTKESKVAKPSASTIRVDLNKLDNLIDSAGELILSKNRLLDFSRKWVNNQDSGDPVEFLDTYNAELGLITSEIQSTIMKTRMQPVQKVFSKYPKIVRDLARKLGKDMELIVQGEDTELDNTIIEEIGDPMIHLVRNSCDHGIETPEERQKAGKSPKGRVVLAAYYEGNNAIIKISDDGKGMDANVIGKKGIEKGIITEDQLKVMEKKDILNLIFEAGFSTNQEVTDVSGRGVGMDVVRSNIQKLKGSVELDSTPGKGSAVLIKLPLTLAVMKVLEVQVEEERYLIPIDEVSETSLVPDSHELEILKQTFPIVPLKEVLDVPSVKGDGGMESRYIVMLKSGSSAIALLVDNIIQQHEVLIKPLGGFLENFSSDKISGATIMGDGSVQLILDNKNILQEAMEMAQMEAA